MAPDATYLPGHGERTTRMLAARTAHERAAFVPQHRLSGADVVDLGCGPATVTAGLAHRVGAGGRLLALDVADDARRAAVATLRQNAPHATVLGGAATALPLAGGSVDLVFAHALFEHLPEPSVVLAEIRRVLRPRGAVALVSSDWSGARIEPDDPDARSAVDGYRRARRRAGADPDAGSRLGAWVADAGFTVVHAAGHWREDLVGVDLARYIGERLGDDPAARAAVAWSRQRTPTRVRQHWVEVLGVLDG